MLGVRLLPYTVGHALVLQRLRSPFVFGGPVSVQHLVEAVTVCSQPSVESMRTIQSRFAGIVMWFWVRKIKRMDLVAESDKFNLWLKDQSTAPEVLIEPGKNRDVTMPWPERILVGCLDIGLNSSEIISMPIGDAERLILAHAEMHGHVKLWSDTAEQIWQAQQNN